MKSLVIVESPAKAKTINKILGKDFGVKASVGHVKDLPKKELGVAIDNNFKPTYITIPGKEKVIRELKSEAKKADAIYIATDPDREGEAIAYHIAEEITPSKGKGRTKNIYRVAFHEITERAVKEAIKTPGNIDINKVDAQQARRILDRLVGYKLSPFLWKKIRRGLSAGRVQSVAVKLIVDREREIQAFKKEEYWTIKALLQPVNISDTSSAPQSFSANLYKYNDMLVVNRDAEEDKKFLIKNEDDANKIVDEIKNKDFYLIKIDKKQRKKSPSPPFITSTLQQEASRKLRFPAKKTMMIAQQLYEGVELGNEGSVGLITYMRTDSFRIAAEAQEWAKDLIKSIFGKEYLPEKTPYYKSKSSAQDAHEAIRPTYPDKTPEKLKPYLSKDQYNLYSLIWKRFIASQMSAAILDQTTYIIGLREEGREISGAELRTSGTVVRFQGFMALYAESKDEMEEEEGGILPTINENDLLRQNEISPNQHFTQPPPRYTEAALVKALEEKGIGRPSTYAAILSTIQDRKYAEKNEDRRFLPTELGIVVNDLLVEKFPELIDLSFTAKMEDELDEIESAKMKWVKVVNDFYTPFSIDLEKASNDNEGVKPGNTETDQKCDKCGAPMLIKWGRHGKFLACSGYPECKNTKPIEGENSGVQKAEPVITDEICDKCGAPMVIKSGKFGKFLACSKYPECKNAKPIATGIKCPLDGGDIVARKTKKGKPFWSCSNYPKCKFATWYKPVAKSCPKCNAPILAEQRTKGGDVFLICLSKECRHKEAVKEEQAGEEA